MTISEHNLPGGSSPPSVKGQVEATKLTSDTLQQWKKILVLEIEGH